MLQNPTEQKFNDKLKTNKRTKISQSFNVKVIGRDKWYRSGDINKQIDYQATSVFSPPISFLLLYRNVIFLGGFRVNDTPQIVLLTFDDSVNDLNKKLFSDLFEKGRLNPNGCPIAGTFYVSHEWTDYGQVQNLYADGHEIASHTIS